MRFTKFAVSFGILFAGAVTVAVPVLDTREASHSTILKRANPTIGGGIDINDLNQGGRLVPRPGVLNSGGFSNALELMSYATNVPRALNDAVFGKYFSDGDRQVVMALFQRLLGDDGATGAAALANIQVIAGANDFPAELVGFDDPGPELVLSEDAWVYPDRDSDPNACAT